MQVIRRGHPVGGAPSRGRIPVGRREYPSPYFTLSCGHFTNREDQDLSLFWRPKRGVYWCNRCNKWLSLPPKKKVAPLPQEPMF
jgi:hypothetical protein